MRSRGRRTGRGRLSPSGAGRRSSAGSSRAAGRARPGWRSGGIRRSDRKRSTSASRSCRHSSRARPGFCLAFAPGTRRTSCSPTRTADLKRRRSAAIGIAGDGVQALARACVGGVDEGPERVCGLAGPDRVRVALGAVGQVAEDVRRSTAGARSRRRRRSSGSGHGPRRCRTGRGRRTRRRRRGSGRRGSSRSAGFVQATSRYRFRVFGPGPTRIGVSSAQTTPAVMTSALISMFTCRTAAAARARSAWTKPVRGADPGQRLQDRGAPLDRDMVDDHEEHRQGTGVQPPGHGPGLARVRRRRGLVHPAARARDRVTVVLHRPRRGQRHLDHLPRPGNPQVSGIRKVAAALAGPGWEQRHRVIRVVPPGEVRTRARRAASRAASRSRRVSAGQGPSGRAGHPPRAASRSCPSSATPAAPAGPAAPPGQRPARTAPSSAPPGPRSARPAPQPEQRGHHRAARSQPEILPSATATPPANSRNAAQP